jgi:hypothetical protein
VALDSSVHETQEMNGSLKMMAEGRTSSFSKRIDSISLKSFSKWYSQVEALAVSAAV